MTVRISRRTVLKGLGTAIPLPWLESIITAAPATAPAAKLRTAFLYVPNGMHMADWTPSHVGALGQLPATLEPLAAFKNQLNVLTGLTLDKARANGDGPGDHARAMSAFLTGKQPRKTGGADIRLGKSADQHIAEVVGDTTKFASLELGIERGLSSGNCDSGYACAYQSNFSWRGERTPNAKEVDPKQVFDRLFGNGGAKDQNASKAQRDRTTKSILDFVREDAKSLSSELAMADRRKVDEYLTGVREIEVRIEKARQVKDSKTTFKPTIDAPVPGVPKDVREHIKLMCDLSVLAFQADLTRVITLPFANDGSNRTHPFLGITNGHHEISHHQNDKEKQAKIQKINRFHVENLAYLLGKLAEVKEGDKSLLDLSMIVYGSGIGDGNRHNHDDLPILLAGRAGGKLQTGRHLKFDKDTPLMNLYLAMFERMGCPAKSFGDSTGVLSI